MTYYRLQDFTTVGEIESAMAAVTPEDITRVNRHLDPPEPSEQVLGEVNDRLKTLWTAADEFRLKTEEFGIMLRHRVATDAEEREVQQLGMRTHELYEVARSIFWLEAKEQIPEARQVEHGVGVRRGWLLVSIEKPQPQIDPVSFLKAIASGTRLLQNLEGDLSPQPKTPKRKKKTVVQ